MIEDLALTHLSVVVPAFSEGKSIYEALTRLIAALDQLGIDYEVLVVSDGSTDATVEEASRFGHHAVKVLHYELNRGKGYALRYGFGFATGSHVAFIDADMDLDPSGVGRLLQLMAETKADAVVGSKVHPASQVSYPAFRRLQSRIYRGIVALLFRLHVADTQTGLKVFRREPLDAVMHSMTSDGFAFDLELLVRINDANFRIVEGPVQLRYQFATTTGARAVLDVLKDTMRIAMLRARDRRRSSRRASS